MSLKKKLETSKGVLHIIVKKIQKVENDTKWLIEMTATNVEHHFHNKTELRIPVEQGTPTEAQFHAFERKVEEMFISKKPKELGYEGTL